MTGVPEAPIRVGEKQTRVADVNRRVSVIDSVGRLVGVIREPSAIGRYLLAPNAETVRDHRGQLRAIKLASLADERGKPGERHGNSLVTTERCKNRRGEYIGTHTTLKHKLDRSDV
jgi:hypothetical protein